jgi:hypothetical protein
MTIQRYGVHDPVSLLVECHWRPVNTPFFGASAGVLCLLYHVEDGTAQFVTIPRPH